MVDMTARQGQSTPYPDAMRSSEMAAAVDVLPYVHNRELYRVRASVLSGLFRDEIVVQEKTVSIIHNAFLSSYVETLPIRDIGRVIEINTAFLCGLRILGKNPSHDIRIKGLRKQDLIQCKLIMEGLMLEDPGDTSISSNFPAEIRSEVLADAAQIPDATDQLRPPQYP